jgi:hypothetical protein
VGASITNVEFGKTASAMLADGYTEISNPSGYSMYVDASGKIGAVLGFDRDDAAVIGLSSGLQALFMASGPGGLAAFDALRTFVAETIWPSGAGLVDPAHLTETYSDGFNGDTQSHDAAVVTPGMAVWRVEASDQSDILAGTDTFLGFGGSDTIDGMQGDDVIFAYGGDDVVHGGEGNDVVWGQDGDDELYGDAGDNILRGGAGQNKLVGGLGLDRLYGGEGNDNLYTAPEGANLSPGGGQYLLDENGDPIVKGGEDILDGGQGYDTYYLNSLKGLYPIIVGDVLVATEQMPLPTETIVYDSDGQGRLVWNGQEIKSVGQDIYVDWLDYQLPISAEMNGDDLIIHLPVSRLISSSGQLPYYLLHDWVYSSFYQTDVPPEFADVAASTIVIKNYQDNGLGFYFDGGLGPRVGG